MSTTEIKIGLDELEKRKLEKNANSMGLSVEEVIKLMIDQFNRSCRIKRKDSLDDFLLFLVRLKRRCGLLRLKNLV
ncbi:hypothetical protein KIMC2_03300 [Xylocopilactobacillus apis]|uniref:Uncharacterized protein n=1 Tax=Xylocopilactobacillus apis TaxID=2932183 RepID=A0AAU9CWV0_9LACO|nr:hypothetical protein KIMC2_03300 [Xylocopilactobacillus apis]